MLLYSMMAITVQLFTNNLGNLKDAKISFALSATPNVAGVSGADYNNGYDNN